MTVMSPASYRNQVSEAALQEVAVELAGRLGYRTYHNRDSRGSTPGFPDLVILGHGLIVFVELKTATGKLRPAQHEWIAELQRAGVPVIVLRPDGMDDYENMLRRGVTDAL